jgi:hypothetical protein
METVGKVELVFLKDRNVNKVRVNLIKNDRIFGFIKPTNFWR